jgi:hypothetical protein
VFLTQQEELKNMEHIIQKKPAGFDHLKCGFCFLEFLCSFFCAFSSHIKQKTQRGAQPRVSGTYLRFDSEPQAERSD